MGGDFDRHEGIGGGETRGLGDGEMGRLGDGETEFILYFPFPFPLKPKT
jgi:hypothetical protein